MTTIPDHVAPSGPSLGRRQFILGAAAGLGGLMVPTGVKAQLLQSAAQPFSPAGLPNMQNYSVPSVSHWGAFTANVEGGRMVSVTPFAEDKFPSPMIRAMPDLLYSPNRVQAPMVRQGFYKNRHKSDTSGRGSEPFVEVSWDEATAMVAEEITRVKKQYGNRSIYAGSYGWQSAGTFHSATASLQRLMGLMGGFVWYVNSYSAPTLPVIMPHVLGDAAPQQSAWPTILKNSDLVILIGYNPLINDEIQYGGEANHYDFEYLEQLRASGIPIVYVNPTNEDTNVYLGAEHIALRPNTDTAFMLGIANELYTKGLHDKAFLDKYTVGFDKFADYLTGKSDGIPKTPEWAAAISEIDADTIRKLAARMAKGKTALVGGYSLQRADHGEQPVWMIVTLSAMLGKFGTAGGGVQMDFPPGLGVPAGSAPAVPGLPAGANPVKDFVPINMWTDLLLNPGKTIDYDGRKITYPDIKLVYWAGGNPFHHGQDTNRVVKAWQRPEVTIVHDYNWTATAKHADIVLPATMTLERNDIVSDGRFIMAMKQVVPPAFSARNDYDIFADIADHLGQRQAFTEGKDEAAWLRSSYETAQKAAQAKGVAMPSFDAFWAKGYLEFPEAAGADAKVAYADFIADPITNALGTPSGKIEIYSEKIASFKYDDCPPHPTWLPPSEWLGSPKARTYPLHMISGHPKYRLHSQLDNTFIRDMYEVNEREPVWINPGDAAARGIAQGDVVRVFNDRGQVLAGAVVTDRVRPSVIKLHEGGWYDPQHPGKAGTLDKHGSANTLTTDKPNSKLSEGNPSHTCLVQIEKYTAELPPISAFSPPPMAKV
jgi:trimethylamine-N-oxide reductase (cytochrome c)